MNKRTCKDILLPLIGVLIGGAITLTGTLVTIDSQFELANIDQKATVCSDMLESIYSLQQMDEGLIDEDIEGFRNESYAIMAKAKIYCDEKTVELYDQFLKKIFSTGIYDGKMVDDKLIPAIREDLKVD